MNTNKKLDFPKSFYLGGAIAAEEVEGYGTTRKTKTEWDLFFQEAPTSFYYGISNSFTNNMMACYKQDLDLFKKVGCDSLRISISWARIFPEENGEANKEAIKYYHDLIDYANKIGIKIIVTLMHFDLPAYCFKKKEDGWVNKTTIENFLVFAKTIFHEYHEKVIAFATLNEPRVILFGYNGSLKRYPLLDNNKLGFQAACNEIIAHAKVVNYFKNYFPNTKAKIGIVVDWNHAYPKNNKDFSDEDVVAADAFNHLYNYFFLSPAILGEFEDKTKEYLQKINCTFEISQEDLNLIKTAKIDWLGVNFYAPTRVQKTEDPKALFKEYVWKEARVNVFRGWEIHPETLLLIANIIKEKYNNIPWMICENGMGVENENQWRNIETQNINDDYRIAYISEHLEFLLKAIHEHQANCFGYHLWSVIDNWSWINAYKNRYGLIEINLNNQERIIKKSGYWYSELQKRRFLELNYPKIEDVINLKEVKYTKSK